MPHLFPGLLQSSHGQCGACSHRQKVSMCVNDVPLLWVFQTCAKINFHQRSGGNSIPPSPGDESSVFWRENRRAASVLSTTVDITQPVCQVYRKVLKVFSPRVQHKVKVSLFRHPKHTIKVLNWEHYDYHSGVARLLCSGPTLTVLKQKIVQPKMI